MVKAINELLANNEPYLSTLQRNIATVLNEENDNTTDDIDSKLEELQQLDWQPFFGQNYSEQEITLTTVLIQLISECLTLYISLALDNLKNHEFLYYYTNKYTLLILTATPLMSQICSDI